MDLSTILRGFVLGLSITAPVGPTNIEVIRRGTRAGWRAAAVFCLGVMLTLVVYLLLVALGLSFLTRLAWFNTLLLGLGVGVLGYLAYTSLRDFARGIELDLGGQPGSSQRHFVPGIVLTASNPAVLLLWTGIMGADLAASRASPGRGLWLSLGILMGVAVFFSGLTALIHFGRKLLRPGTFKYVSLAAGLVLLFFCVRFGYTLIRQVL